ncbi:MAG: DUF1638 domain-containing protein [Rhodospirillaceae bacterium]|jgi:hypothetical protein|nr:DUF1638 domain-containing protein [Rhodospirillaceae bacterium]
MQKTLLICCGATAREVLAIVEGNGMGHMQVESLPAGLHNTPQFIPERVREKIRANRDQFERILVLYSDCGTGGRLQAVLDEEGVEGLGGAHCYEMYAGAAAFASITDEEIGCFFLTDYLTRHFERLVIQGLGLDRHPELRDSYFGNYKKILYLAQRDDPDLRARAEAAAAQLGLELEIRRTGLGDYRDFLLRHVEKS